MKRASECVFPLAFVSYLARVCFNVRTKQTNLQPPTPPLSRICHLHRQMPGLNFSFVQFSCSYERQRRCGGNAQNRSACGNHASANLERLRLWPIEVGAMFKQIRNVSKDAWSFSLQTSGLSALADRCGVVPILMRIDAERRLEIKWVCHPPHPPMGTTAPWSHFGRNPMTNPFYRNKMGLS